MTTDRINDRLRFGAFEVDLETGQLQSDGQSLRLPEKPYQALLLLLERSGQVVTREELQQRLWPANTFVEFDDNLNATIKRLREALKDSATRPKYVETLPRRGYKFLLPVERLPSPTSLSTSPAQANLSPVAAELRSRFEWSALPKIKVAIVILGMVLLAAAALHRGVKSQKSSRQITIRTAVPAVLAVLPVKNLTQNSELQFLAEGLTQDLSGRLRRIAPSQLTVLGPVSSSQISPNHPVPEAVRDFTLDYFLTNELRTDRNTLWLESGLVRVGNHQQIWTEKFELPLQEAFAAILIARQVSSKLNISPFVEDRTQLSHRETADRAAYEDYLRGSFALQRGKAADLKSALQLFDDSLQNDPEFVMPFVGKARAYVMLATQRPATAKIESSTEAAINAGLALDPAIAELSILRGDFLVQSGASHEEIEKMYQRALKADPNNTEALEQYAIYLRERRPKDALPLIERAFHLDPFSSRTNALFGWVLISNGNLDEASKHLRSALALDPEMPMTLVLLGNLEVHRGRTEDAVSWFEKAASASGREPQYVYRLGRAYAQAGRREDVRRVLAELRGLARSRTVEPQYIHNLEVMLGG